MTHFKSVIELLDYFKDEQTCIDYLEQKTWDGKPICPYCGSGSFYVVKGGYRCKEKGCCKRYNVRTKSIFECSNVPLRTWFAAIYLCTAHKKGISSIQLGTDLNISQKSAWFLAHRIRNTFFDTEQRVLTDVVSVDETFIGGKNKNRHADKKVEGGQGGNSSDKTIVMGAMQIGGIVSTQIIPDRTEETLMQTIDKIIKKGSIIVTDDHQSYNKAKQDYFHIIVNHNEKQYVNGAFSTNNIEGFWSLFKRGYVGTYHYMSPKHLSRYCDEFSYRYNRRTISSEARFADAMIRTPNKRLTYKDLTGKK